MSDETSMLDALLCPTCKGVGLVDPAESGDAVGPKGLPSALATDDHNPPPPTPSDHQDLAELKREISEAIRENIWKIDGAWEIEVDVMAIVSPLLLRVETAERGRAEQWRIARERSSTLDVLKAANLTLRDDLARAVEALEPFAAALKKYETDCFFASREASIIVPDEVPVLLPGYEEEADAARFTIGDLRRASETLTSLPNQTTPADLSVESGE